MKSLDNIPKKNVYKVPEGYFDTLPGVIQSRISNEKPERSIILTYSLRLALPVLLIGIAVYLFWFNGNKQPANAEEMLASVDTEYLVSYLDEAGALDDAFYQNTSELTNTDIDAIEGMVYFGLDDQSPETDAAFDELQQEYTIDIDKSE
jgi:hypothetical protein